MANRRSNVPVKKTFPGWAWGLVVVAIAALGFAVYRLTQAEPQQAVYPSEVTVAEAAQKRDQGAFILDVRQPDEWQQVHIPGALLIPLADLPNRLGEVPKDKEVVVVCRSGNRSKTGRDILRQAGYERVTSLAGGVTDWQAKGLPTESGE